MGRWRTVVFCSWGGEGVVVFVVFGDVSNVRSDKGRRAEALLACFGVGSLGKDATVWGLCDLGGLFVRFTMTMTEESVNSGVPDLGFSFSISPESPPFMLAVMKLHIELSEDCAL